jgi:hypothetical protein
MYNVTQDFINKIKQDGRQFRATVTIRNTVFSDDDIVSIDLDENVNPADSFMLGGTGSSKLEVTLMNVTADLIFDGADVAAVISLFTGSMFEDVPLGVFWVDEISKNKGIVKLTCFDNMIKLEKAYFSDLTYPASINAVAQEICTKAGVELFSSLPDTQINKIEGYTCREAIGFIASFLGGFTRFNKLGKLEITSYADSGFTVEADNYFPPLTIAEKPFTVGKLTCKTGDSALTSGINGNEIQFENPIMTQVQLDSILSTLSTLSYMPYSVDWQGNQALQAGDKIIIIDENNNTYNTLLMQNKLSYSGGLKSSAAAVGKTDNAQEFNSSGSMKSTVDRMVVEQANIKVLLADKATIEDLTATNGRIDNLSSTYATIINLNAATARIGTLETTTAHITNGVIDNATIDVAKVNNLSANYAHITNGVIDNAVIDTANINNLSANYAHLTNGVIDMTQIADGSITDAKIVSLTANKISAGTIDAANIEVINLKAANITVGTINGQQISQGTITDENIADGTITQTKLSQDLVNTLAQNQTDINNAMSDISDLEGNFQTISTDVSVAQTTADGKNTVFYTTAAPTGTHKANDIWFDIDDGNKMYNWDGSAWTAAQFGTNAIANLAITNALIADATIQNAKISALDAVKITTGTLSADRIGALSITAAKIAAGAITTDKVGANQITAAKIAVGTITANEIAASTITGAKIAAITITAANIAANTITASQIAASTITATQIAANTITGDKLVADSITAREIASKTITANEIAAGTITANEIKANTITATQMQTGTITATSGIIASIDASVIKTGSMVADRIQGGTLTLGGASNGNGSFILKDSLGAIGLTLDKDGFKMILTTDGDLNNNSFEIWRQDATEALLRITKLSDFIYNGSASFEDLDVGYGTGSGGLNVAGSIVEGGNLLENKYMKGNSQLIFATRDLSIAGVQTIAGLSGKPKRITFGVAINGGSFFCSGSWEGANNAQAVTSMYRNSTNLLQGGCSNAIAISCPITQSISLNGTVQNVVDGQFQINWTKTGSPTGIANLQMNVYY